MIKMQKATLFLNIKLLAVAILTLSFPSGVMAQAQQPGPITIQPMAGFGSAQEALNTLLPVVFFIGGLLCLVYLIWGAYKYLTAGDNAANTAAGRQTMMNAAIGLVLLGLVVVIFRIVTEIANLDGIFFQ